MVFYKNKYFLLLLLFLLMLVDGQMSFVMSSLFSYYFLISSHLFLLAVMYFYHDKNDAFTLWSSIFLGAIFDIYYLNRIGLIVFLLPMLALFISKISKKFFANDYQTLIFYIIILFLFEISGELAAVWLGMTTMSVAHFIAYSFAPSLVFNILLYFIFRNLLKKLFLGA